MKTIIILFIILLIQICQAVCDIPEFVKLKRVDYKEKIIHISEPWEPYYLRLGYRALFDSLGNITEEFNYLGEFCNFRKFYYDNLGKLNHIKRYSRDIPSTSTDTMIYNNEHILFFVELIKFDYNVKGLMEKKSIYSDSNKLVRNEFYIFDDRNNLIEVDTHSYSDSSKIFYKYDSIGNLIKEFVIAEKQEYYHSDYCYENNKLSKFSYFFGTSGVLYEDFYVYNESGLLIKKISKKLENELRNETYFVYTKANKIKFEIKKDAPKYDEGLMITEYIY